MGQGPLWHCRLARGLTEHCLLAIRGQPVYSGGKQGTVLNACCHDHSEAGRVLRTGRKFLSWREGSYSQGRPEWGGWLSGTRSVIWIRPRLRLQFRNDRDPCWPVTKFHSPVGHSPGPRRTRHSNLSATSDKKSIDDQMRSVGKPRSVRPLYLRFYGQEKRPSGEESNSDDERAKKCLS